MGQEYLGKVSKLLYSRTSSKTFALVAALTLAHSAPTTSRRDGAIAVAAANAL